MADARERQPSERRLWVVLALLVVLGAFLVAFVVANTEEVDVSFVAFSATTSLIWVILLSLLIGLVAGLLAPQVLRRRRRAR